MYCSVFKVPCLIEFIWDSLFIISQISEFVNSFSKFFLWFFWKSSFSAFTVLSNQFLLVSFTLSDDFFIIPQIFHFVKCFFRLFQNLFCDCHLCQTTCLLYHKTQQFVNMTIYSNSRGDFINYLYLFNISGFLKKINFQKKWKILCFFYKILFSNRSFYDIICL